MDIKDIAKDVAEKVDKIDKKEVEKVVDAVKDGAKELGINDVEDVKEKAMEVASKLKK